MRLFKWCLGGRSSAEAFGEASRPGMKDARAACDIRECESFRSPWDRPCVCVPAKPKVCRIVHC